MNRGHDQQVRRIEKEKEEKGKTDSMDSFAVMGVAKTGKVLRFMWSTEKEARYDPECFILP